MSQKKHEALDKRNFHQYVTQTHRHEIKERDRRLTPSLKRKRQNQKCQHCGHGDRQHQQQHQHSQVHLPINSIPQTLRTQDLPSLESKEKKRRVIADRSHVVGITSREAVRIITRDQVRKRIISWIRRQIERLELLILVEMSLHRGLFFFGKCSFLGQHHHGNPIFIERPLRCHNKVPRQVSDAKTMQRFHRHRYHAQGLARLAELPASDGNHSLWFKMLEIFPK